jgi:hypothetical protein
MIGYGDMVFRTLFGLLRTVFRWSPAPCRKTSVSRQGAIQPIGTNVPGARPLELNDMTQKIAA